jgi:hypothetical protein
LFVLFSRFFNFKNAKEKLLIWINPQSWDNADVTQSGIKGAATLIQQRQNRIISRNNDIIINIIGKISHFNNFSGKCSFFLFGLSSWVK